MPRKGRRPGAGKAQKARKALSARTARPELEFHPLTADRWGDLVALFGPRGACAGCWCMWWRVSSREFEAKKGALNRSALRRLAVSAEPPGILAYVDGRAVGWCAVGPREAFPRLETSRVLKRVDADEVWSIPCIFIDKGWRRRGVSVGLVRAAVDHAASRGARLVEAYPRDVLRDQPDAFVWTGLVPTFRRAGFVEVARRSPTRPIMRARALER